MVDWKATYMALSDIFKTIDDEQAVLFNYPPRIIIEKTIPITDLRRSQAFWCNRPVVASPTDEEKQAVAQQVVDLFTGFDVVIRRKYNYPQHVLAYIVFINPVVI